MFMFKRPFAAVTAGLITAFLGLAVDTAFATAWAAQHVAHNSRQHEEGHRDTGDGSKVTEET